VIIHERGKNDIIVTDFSLNEFCLQARVETPEKQKSPSKPTGKSNLLSNQNVNLLSHFLHVESIETKTENKLLQFTLKRMGKIKYLL